MDDEIRRLLSSIRRARFLANFPSFSSNNIGGEDFAWRIRRWIRRRKTRRSGWCARLWRYTENLDRFDEFLLRARQLGDGPDVTIAQLLDLLRKAILKPQLSKFAEQNRLLRLCRAYSCYSPARCGVCHRMAIEVWYRSR